MDKGRWQFAEAHMPSIRKILGDLPARTFFNVQTASVERDMQEATDLVLSMGSGDIAVRVRRNSYYQKAQRHGYDWSVRSKSNGHKTEIHKLREGFGRWYFFAYSADDKGTIAAWWVLDMNKVRSMRILDRDWKEYPNGDGTSGKYIPVRLLYKAGCVVAGTPVEPVERQPRVLQDTRPYAFAQRTA